MLWFVVDDGVVGCSSRDRKRKFKKGGRPINTHNSRFRSLLSYCPLCIFLFCVYHCRSFLLLCPPSIVLVIIFIWNTIRYIHRADGKDQKTYKQHRTPIISDRISKREAFMLCGLIESIDEALTHHKKMACPAGTANLARVYTVFNDPYNT